MAWKNAALISTFALAACSAQSDAVVKNDLVEPIDERASTADGLATDLPIGSTLQTTANLNLRTGADTSYPVRLVIPQGATVVTVNRTSPDGAFYNVRYNGVTGWSHGGYLLLVQATPPTTPPGGTGSRADALARARSGVGFSYWWGHGRWQPGGLSSSNAGSCTGNCPNCSHSGGNGADCSGFVAKVWQVPASNADATEDSHPYSTVSFNGSNSQWRTVSRGAVQPGDALVYNTNGAGHVFIYESGDGWGSMWVYEARGCSAGIGHNLRTAGSDYKAIAHY